MSVVEALLLDCRIPELSLVVVSVEVGCQVGRARYRLQLEVAIIAAVIVEDLVDEKLLVLLVLLLSQNSEEAFGQSLRRPGRSSNEGGGRLHTGADKGRAPIAVDRVTCSLGSLLCGIVVWDGVVRVGKPQTVIHRFFVCAEDFVDGLQIVSIVSQRLCSGAPRLRFSCMHTSGGMLSSTTNAIKSVRRSSSILQVLVSCSSSFAEIPAILDGSSGFSPASDSKASCCSGTGLPCNDMAAEEFWDEGGGGAAWYGRCCDLKKRKLRLRCAIRRSSNGIENAEWHRCAGEGGCDWRSESWQVRMEARGQS
jgi:hypothetical protein